MVRSAETFAAPAACPLGEFVRLWCRRPSLAWRFWAFNDRDAMHRLAFKAVYLILSVPIIL